MVRVRRKGIWVLGAVACILALGIGSIQVTYAMLSRPIWVAVSLDYTNGARSITAKEFAQYVEIQKMDTTNWIKIALADDGKELYMYKTVLATGAETDPIFESVEVNFGIEEVYKNGKEGNIVYTYKDGKLEKISFWKITGTDDSGNEKKEEVTFDDDGYFYVQKAMKAGECYKLFDYVKLDESADNDMADLEFQIHITAEMIQEANFVPKMGDAGDEIIGWNDAEIKQYKPQV